MLAISEMSKGERGVVMELPVNQDLKRQLLVHGIHIGGQITLIQTYGLQELALIGHNGRKIALRHLDCQQIKVVKVDA